MTVDKKNITFLLTSPPLYRNKTPYSCKPKFCAPTETKKAIKITVSEENPAVNNVIANKKIASNNDTQQNEAQEVPNVQPSATDAATPAAQMEAASECNVNKQLVNRLCSIFPDACPDYIRSLCHNKTMNITVVDHLTTLILNTNGQYPKRTVVYQEPETCPENQLEILKEFLPDADPDYLKKMCDSFGGKADAVENFINKAMKRRDYPTMKDYQRRQQFYAQQKQYTKDFNVQQFVTVFPDPESFFTKRLLVNIHSSSLQYARTFLKNTFLYIPSRRIDTIFEKNKYSVIKTFKELKKIEADGENVLKNKRKQMKITNPRRYYKNHISLLQEIAYLKHYDEINDYLQKIKKNEETERKEAKRMGLLKTCRCCFDEEVFSKDFLTCKKGCPFCKSCILKSTEVRFGEGRLDFPCLQQCSSHFTLQTLQAALPPNLFSKIAQKKALEEVKCAGIEELETCPFCDFAMIPPEGYKIFTCLNPDCMMESCRFCKEPSHIPFRCDEIEKDDQVKARVFVENQMTEALLKKCWKCGIKFFKEEGCNKMTCSCGASMCYVCGEPVSDYTHFNGPGGDKYHLCPLFSDTHKLNKENVLKAAEKAKAEIGNKELKHDPTKDVNEHYEERAKKVPQRELL